MIIDLFDFQAEDVLKLKSKRSRLIGNDPGTGKTYEGIALDQANRSGDGNEKIDIKDYPVKKTLIVAPKSVLGVWDEHCMELTDEDVYVIDTKNRSAFVKACMNKKTDGYFVCNWDALRLMPELKDMVWFHIIADEVHRAKNRKAQQTRALKKLKAVYKTGMSGTPADNKPQDLWSILNWLWPNYYTSFWRFVKAYLVSQMTEEGYTKFIGVQNEKHLQKQMKPWFVRRKKEDVLPDLPDKYYSRVWVDLGPKQRKAYDQMRKTMIAWVEQHKDELDREDPVIAQAVVAQLVRLQQFADGYVIPRLDASGNPVYKMVHKGHKRSKVEPCTDKCGPRQQFDVTDPSAKLDVLMDLLEDRSDEQIIVWSVFKSVINLLGARLDERNIPYGILTGDVKQHARTESVQDFQAGKTRVFIGTIAAGGIGITLTASSTVIFIDRSWSPSINTQAEDRAHRIGQEEAVEVIDMMGKNTVDLGKAQQLATKTKWLQLLLGDKVDTAEVINQITLEDKQFTEGIADMLKREGE